MAWIQYNANPDGIKEQDCTVRAISAALGISWDDAYVGIAAEGLRMKQMPSTNAVWGAYLERSGFRRTQVPNTVRDFCREHPKGLYVLGLQGHVITVIDGNYYDFWDSGDEVPLYVWEA